MKTNKLICFVTSVFAVLAMSGCAQEKKQESTYDGRVFDISLNQDQSVLAESIKSNNHYELAIYGSGPAKDYASKTKVPWNPIIKMIKKVTIENGIENIGDYYFNSLPLERFILPESVQSVGDHSFNSNSVIYTFGGQLDNIDNDVYYYSETKPTKPGKYFYMQDGEPVQWVLTPLSFLFIGNSFTYRGASGTTDNPEIPRNFKTFADSLDIEVNIDYVVEGSYTLTKYANKDDPKGAIVEDKLTHNQYDYVILQEQSTTPINNKNTFIAAVKKLNTRIKETQTKCQVILYETWGTPYNTAQDPTTYGSTVSEMEAKLRAAYEEAADEIDAKVHYVGKAFAYVYDTLKTNIFVDDNRHQDGYGAFLSAACHIRSFFHVKMADSLVRCGLTDETKCKALLGVADTIC